MKSRWFFPIAAMSFAVILFVGCADNITQPTTIQAPSQLNKACPQAGARGVLFTRYMNDLLDLGPTSEIFIVQASGENPQRLTHNLVHDENAVWLPNSDCVIDVSMNTGVHYLEMFCVGDSVGIPVFQNSTSHTVSPSATANGSKLCYIRRDRYGIKGVIELISRMSNVATRYPFDPMGDPAEARISPDGSKVVCVSYDTPGIFLLDLSSGSVTKIVDGTECDSPAFSPDGRTIVFSRRSEENEFATQLWTVDLPSKEVTQVTGRNDVKDVDPAFSPDGLSLVFSRRLLPDGDPTFHLFTCQKDGSDVVQITNSDSNDRFPDWR